MDIMDLKQHSELLANLAAAREEYRAMGTGHAGLGGFCIALSGRMARMSERFFNPLQTQQQNAEQTPDDCETANA